MKRFLILTGLVLCLASAAAQGTRRDSIRQRVREQALRIDSLLAEKNSRVSYDTAYIGRPQSRITLKLRGNVIDYLAFWHIAFVDEKQLQPCAKPPARSATSSIALSFCNSTVPPCSTRRATSTRNSFACSMRTSVTTAT